MDKTVAKRKTSMLLYTIEESLGKFVYKNENTLKCQNENDYINISDVIEKSYLDEIYNLVIKATKDTPEEIHVKRLYKLSHDLNIFEIRNAIAHPNRIFLDVFWYRLAAIAADPAFENIGLLEIKKCLFSAENGIINDPPEGWEKRFNWDIPNNLPNKFESDITGLIGRNKEIAELNDKLSNPRISSLAIVAPGGFGKTAVALDLLQQIVTSSDSTKWLDAVCYITLKNETWDNGKFIKLDAISEISAIEDAIAEQLGIIFDQYIDNIEQAIEEFSEKRIILCIDNLETILRDNDAFFHEFTEKLPRDWKVLVTSRVVITNSFIYTLGELKEMPATHLARLYNRNKGGDELTQERYIQIAKNCHQNPLAIKMTLDLYISGKEIPSSIDEAKSNIAYFSFSNLIESLTNNALSILELIFIDSCTTRKTVCEILALSTDDSATAINELSRTSLINRLSLPDRESYEINGSIVDLMIVNPKCLAIRTEIHEKLNKRKTITTEIETKQRQSKMPEWHIQYIPSTIDDGLKLLMREFAKLRFSNNQSQSQSQSKITDVYLKFKKVEEHYKNDFIFQRSFAKILQSLQLITDAEKCYEKAISLSSDNVTRYMKARFHFEQNDYSTASDEYNEIIKQISLEKITPENQSFYDTVYQGYFLSHLYSNKYETILEITKKWKEHPIFRSLFGTYRASAYKRKIEILPRSNTADIFSCLNSATKILDDVYRTDGYTQASSTQGIKLIEEICYQLHDESIYKQHLKETFEFLTFCESHLIGIAELVKHRNVDEISSIIHTLSKVNSPQNPFSKNRKWQHFNQVTKTDSLSIDQIQEEYVLAQVVRIPSPKTSGKYTFIFASDGREEYFIHQGAVENYDQLSWQLLKIGHRIAITDSITLAGKSAKEVRACYLVNS